jgi:serine/threonine protein kinase
VPHLVQIHQYGEIGGRPYIDMRLIEGRDLQTVITDGRLDPARAVRIIEQVADALHAAHGVGVLHRNVKPSNILIGDGNNAYLVDFLLAGSTEDTGTMIRSGHYMVPERFSGGRCTRSPRKPGPVVLRQMAMNCAVPRSSPFPAEPHRVWLR